MLNRTERGEAIRAAREAYGYSQLYIERQLPNIPHTYDDTSGYLAAIEAGEIDPLPRHRATLNGWLRLNLTYRDH